MKILTSLFGGVTANKLQLSVTAEGPQSELPYAEIARLLWSYFLNNGLYDELRLVGYFLNEPTLKSLRNPAQRVVKFYADAVWPGKLPKALPLDIPKANEKIREPIEQLWRWSNWQMNKQLAVRLTAPLGECYLRVAQPAGKKRVFLQIIRPEYVTDYDADEQGNLTYIRIDMPQSRRQADEVEFYTHTEVWSKTAGNMRIWEHNKAADTELDQLGNPRQTKPLSAWGIDFVPFVRFVFMDVGADRGVGAYLLSLEKIDEVNRLATRLHSMLFRHNDVTWALKSNMVDSATGRPLPPPRVGTSTDSDGNEVVEMGGERFIRLPGMASLESLVPRLDYTSALEVLNAQMAELKDDLPELRYYELSEVGELSGRAIRLLMGPAITNAVEARSNMEDALIRAQRMALTIGQHMKIWRDLGDYESGDLEHSFEERPIIPVDRYEDAEIIKAEKDAGLPLITSLRKSGWSEKDLAEMEADARRQSALDQAGFASALLEAESRFSAGQDVVAEEAAGVPVGENGQGA